MDAFTEIGVFTRVVDARSFTRAGEQLGMTPSGISRVLSRLEARLGVRLLNRTTRSLSLTDDGAAYYARCSRILAELADADHAMAEARKAPRGRLRVDAPVAIGEHVVGPALPSFLEAFPEVTVDLSLRDHLIDPIAEGIDVVLRLADLHESELISRKLGTARRVIAGAPAYFAKHGRPKEPADLRPHACLGYLSGGAARAWEFSSGSGPLTVAVSGRLHTNSAATLRRTAAAGLGLIQVFEHHIAEDLRSGKLEVVLESHEPEPRPVYALFPRQKHGVPKVRVFVDFLAALFRTAGRKHPRSARGA